MVLTYIIHRNDLELQEFQAKTVLCQGYAEQLWGMREMAFV